MGKRTQYERRGPVGFSVDRLIQSLIGSLVFAGALGLWAHVQLQKDSHAVLQSVQTTGWANCRLAYEQAHKSAKPCYDRTPPVIPTE